MLLAEVVALEVCSAYALLAITVTRYICTAFPLRCSRYVTSRRCVAAVVTLWVTSHTVCACVYAAQEPRERLDVFVVVVVVVVVVCFVVLLCSRPCLLMIFFAFCVWGSF